MTAILGSGTTLPTNDTDPGPRCVNSTRTTIDPAKGAVTLDLRVNFGDVRDRINILALSILSAHRDDEQFPNANTLDLDRRPNGVLGFGHGPHFCIGQPLAKMQTNIALTRLLERFPDLRMTADPSYLEWEPSTLLRGMHHLPAATVPPKS